MATLNRLTHLETSLENLPRGREFKYSPSLIASASECELPTRESVLGSLAQAPRFHQIERRGQAISWQAIPQIHNATLMKELVGIGALKGNIIR